MSTDTPGEDDVEVLEEVEARSSPWYAPITLKRVFVGTWICAGAAALVLIGKNLGADDEVDATEETSVTAPAATPGTITGTMTLRDDIPYSLSEGDFCTGLGGFGDIAAGAQVTVKNEEGRILGIGSLGPGSATNFNRELEKFSCEFEFSVPDVGKARFYSLEVGRRGEITKSRAELEQDDWIFSVALD